MTDSLAPWKVTTPLPLIEGESLDGYVARVAAEHHMPRMSIVTEVAGATASDRQHASFCKEAGLIALADCLRVDLASLRLHSPLWSASAETLNFFGTRVPKDFLQFPARRFSPKALEQSPHHRALWQLRVLPICTETWEYLEDRCPNPSCGRQQVWRRTPGIDLCDFCAAPLTRAQARAVPEPLRDNLEKLVGLVHPNPPRRAASKALLPPRFAGLDGGELLELACALAPIVDHRAAAPLHMRTLSLKTAADVIVPAIAGTWPFLRDWPRGLEQYIADRINHSASPKVDANRGISYRLLTKFEKRGLSQPVCQVIGEFVTQCRNAGDRGLTIHQAARVTGGRRRTLFAMRQAGELPSILSMDGGRLSVLVDKAAVTNLAERYLPRERLVRAAWQIGVPTYAVHELVRVGQLIAAPLPPGCSGQLAVYQDSLQAFQAELSMRLAGEVQDYTVNLARLMRRIGGRPKPWAQVLAAIKSGDLPARLAEGAGPMAQRIMVQNEKVLSMAIFAENHDTDWSGIMVTKADCAEMMNILPHNFSGYSDFLLGPGGNIRDITMEEALKLAKTYILTGELGHRLDVHHSAARHLADHRGLKPEFNGLFKRADAERLVPEITRHTIGAATANPTACAGQPAREATMQSIVSPEGRLRLPPYLRRRLGLGLGGKVLFEETADGILMRPMRRADPAIVARSFDLAKQTSPRAEG